MNLKASGVIEPSQLWQRMSYDLHVHHKQTYVRRTTLPAKPVNQAILLTSIQAHISSSPDPTGSCKLMTAATTISSTLQKPQTPDQKENGLLVVGWCWYMQAHAMLHCFPRAIRVVL